MEKWQRQHIQKNLVELIKNTSCNVHLVSWLSEKEIIGKSDQEILERPHLTPLEKSKLLYEILPTRVDAYDVLKDGLKETTQSEAFRILNEHNSKYRYYGCISYDRNHVLGKGCFGTKVFKGSFGDRDVAVKVVNGDIIDPDYAKREIEFLKQLEGHENIVRYHTAETKDNFIYIALELCLINLQDEMKMKLLKMEPVEILQKTTSGTAHLHRHNVVHRDLKPANILLNYNGQVKISDFGLSKQIPIGRTSVTIHSGVVGTAEWIAPEMLQNISDDEDQIETMQMTTATDIFSLGCIFYFVLTNGTHPFGDSVDRQYNIRHDKPQIIRSSVEENWLQLIEAMISHSPKQRPSAQTILESECFHTGSHQEHKIERKVEDDTKRKPWTEYIGDTKESPSPTNRLSGTFISAVSSIGHSLSPLMDRTRAALAAEGFNDSFNFRSERQEIAVDYLSKKSENISPGSTLRRSMSPILGGTRAFFSHDSWNMFHKPEESVDPLPTIPQNINPRKPLKPTFQNPIPEVQAYLEDPLKSTEILVLCTFNLDICISQIQNSLSEEIPVVEVSIYDKVDNSRKFMHPISIAKVNIFGKEEIDIIRAIDKKILVVTHEVIMGGKGIKKVEHVLSWIDLSSKYQNELVKEILLTFQNEDSELLSLLGESMLENPQIYKNLLNEDLGYLMESKVNSKLMAVLITCFLESEMKSFSKETELPLKDIVFGLASLSNDVNLKEYLIPPILAHFYQYTAIKGFTFFVEKGILSADRLDIDNNCMIKFTAFQDFFTAKVISNCHLLRGSEGLIKKYLVENIHTVGGHSSFKNPRIIYFLDSFIFERRALQSILNVVKREACFFEACISGGYFYFLHQIYQFNTNLFRSIKDPLNCRMADDNLSAVDYFMYFYSKCHIRIISENYTSKSFAIGDAARNPTPLHEILFRNDFNLFELLLRKHGYHQTIIKNKITGLVHLCVMDTNNLDDIYVSNRLKIVEVLSTLNPLLLKGTLSPLSFSNIQVRLVKYLIKAGVSPFDLDDNQSTIAHIAATYMTLENYQELAGVLVEEGYKLVFTTKNKYGEIPLFSVIRHIDLTVSGFDYFLSISENDVKCKGYGSQSLLHTTALSGNLEILRHIIGKGENINIQDEQGDSPLHYVLHDSKRNSLEVVKLLIANQADVNATNKKGLRPLAVIASTMLQGSKENMDVQSKITDILVKAGAH